MVTEQIMNHKTYRHYANLVIKSRQKKTEIIRIVKKCSICKLEKPVTEYNISNKKYGDGFHNYCKACQSAYYKAYNARMRQAKAKEVPQSKVCRDCGSEKPISQFGDRSNSPDKHNIYCKVCWKKRVLISSRKFQEKLRQNGR